MQQLLLDPFVWFNVGCLVAPPLFVRASFSATVEYFSDPFMWFFVALTAATVYIVHGRIFFFNDVLDSKGNRSLSKVRASVSRQLVSNLTDFEQWRARWALLNATIVHGYLDGTIGGFQVNKLFSAQYAKVDKRYAAGRDTAYGAPLFVISCLECFIYLPIGIAVYVAFWRGKACRAGLEILFAAFQLFGTFVYIGSEAMMGFKSMYVDYNLTFSAEHLLYFWFGGVIGVLLWIIVPTWIIVVAMKEITTKSN